MSKSLILFLLISAIITVGCQERVWDNPFDPECPKEIFTPDNFTAIQQGNLVKLTWSQNNTQISGFLIERSLDNGSWTFAATPSKEASTWNDTNIAGGKVHVYRIVAKAGNNPSNERTTQVIPILGSNLTTKPLTKLLSTSAVLGGEITFDGGSPVIARGVCWSSSPNPTISNSKTFDGTGTGTFTSTITVLNANTTYYARAYATTSFGTSYGNGITFKTYFGEVTDIDGNVYPTVKIGDQIWMAENLKTTQYKDGAAIPYVTGNATWAGLSTGAYCWYNNDITNKEIYGALYNWHAVNTNKLPPEGWRVPTDEDWTTLTGYLGGQEVAGGKLKATGTTLWRTPNTGATNESGFTAVPGGSRIPEGGFDAINIHCNLWSASQLSQTQAFYVNVGYGYSILFPLGRLKTSGLSIRCILGTLNLPVITTNAITGITFESAVLGGNVISDGNATVTERGIVYGTSQNPTTSNSKVIIGSGIGIFSGKITGLSQNTTYYAKAYAINSQGTAYGTQLTFKTLPDFLPLDGLVAWYPFNGNAKDESGNNNDGVVYGAVPAPDRFNNIGKAFSFNGTNQFIDLKANPNLAISPLTISVWFKRPQGIIANYNTLVRLRYNGYVLSLNSEGKLQSQYHGGQETLIMSDVKYNDGKWHHCVMSFENKLLKLYVDGKLIASKSGTSNTLTYTFGGIAIGRDGDHDGYYFEGVIDDFAFWNRGLSEEEILKIFNAKF